MKFRFNWPNRYPAWGTIPWWLVKKATQHNKNLKLTNYETTYIQINVQVIGKNQLNFLNDSIKVQGADGNLHSHSPYSPI